MQMQFVYKKSAINSLLKYTVDVATTAYFQACIEKLIICKSHGFYKGAVQLRNLSYPYEVDILIVGIGTTSFYKVILDFFFF